MIVGLCVGLGGLIIICVLLMFCYQSQKKRQLKFVNDKSQIQFNTNDVNISNPNPISMNTTVRGIINKMDLNDEYNNMPQSILSYNPLQSLSSNEACKPVQANSNSFTT